MAEAAEHRRVATAGITPRTKRRRRWLPGTLGAVACSLAAAFCLEQEALREQRMQVGIRQPFVVLPSAWAVLTGEICSVRRGPVSSNLQQRPYQSR